MIMHTFSYLHKDDTFAYRNDAPPDTEITVVSRAASWDDLAELFPRYLQACGFVVSAKDLAEYYAEYQLPEDGDVR